MNRSTRIALGLVAALSVAGCSTKPRQFSAQVRPISGQAAQAGLPMGENTAFASCDKMVRSGRKSEFASAAASSGAATAAVLGSVAGVAASGTVGIGASAAGYAMMAAVPFVGIAAGLGMNRFIRGSRERGYRRHMSVCMGEMGYEVAAWDRAARKQKGTASLTAGANAAMVTAAQSAADEPYSESEAVPAPVASPAPLR